MYTICPAFARRAGGVQKETCWCLTSDLRRCLQLKTEIQGKFVDFP
ncbi:hypothetical protein GCWU000342_00974 [Shuttleworthella satelles DSM 14600]|uniref:Uncharacterized protein n=1 Tax=Shuttleworthella satelles DSM 14600 TaxID=626523 RepID=C4GAM3_9FIRM|nr:hypothetical protein GCWU000342_00974 [Shuttleworthia satelles DSM 14600]